MSWSFKGKAPDRAFEETVRQVFGTHRAGHTPEVVRCLNAVEAFVGEAHKNIPAGAEIHFETSGHLDTRGRGTVTVKVAIGDIVEEAPAPATPAP